MLCGSHIKIWNFANHMKKQNKKHQNLLAKNWKLRIWCLWFHFFHVIWNSISNFNMWTTKHLAQVSCTELTSLVWVDLSRRKRIFYCYRWRFLAKNVVFRAYHKLDAGPPERIGRWELVTTNFGQISSNHNPNQGGRLRPTQT